MKAKTALVTAALMTLGLAACSTGDTGDAGPAQTVTITTPDQVSGRVEDTTVGSVRADDGDPTDTPDDATAPDSFDPESLTDDKVTPPSGVACPTEDQLNGVVTGSDAIDLYLVSLPSDLAAHFAKILEENPQITEQIRSLRRDVEPTQAQAEAFEQFDEIAASPQYGALGEAMKWLDTYCYEAQSGSFQPNS